ncbi:NACHT, LRR and PYD domains-containing protein 3-like isoform X2 [Lepisosteus oculatus]
MSRRTAFEMSLSGEPEAEDGAMGPEIKRVKLERPESSVPRCVSMKSDGSMNPPIEFRGGAFASDPRVKLDRPGSPMSSCVSIKSDGSMNPPIEFREGPIASDRRVKLERPESSVPSCLSMKSDGSMNPPIEFRGGGFASDPRVKLDRPGSPVSSCVSIKSDGSMNPPIEFREGPIASDRRVKLERPESSVPRCVSMKSDGSMNPPIEFRGGGFASDPRVKLDRPGSPMSSCVSIKSDGSMNPPIEFREGPIASDRRVKLERPESSVPRCVSMKSDGSMNPPIEFRGGGFASDPRVKLDRPGSPMSSCVSIKSDGSMNPPIEFREGPIASDRRVKLERPESSVPSCLSMKSDGSMNPPIEFRGGGFASDPRVKLDRPGSPVSSCVSIKSDSSMNPPIEFREGPIAPDPRSAGHGNVFCDFCTDKKIRAVKYCHVCPASYCETHVRQHYTVPALQKHRLVDISGDQEPSLCQQHHRALELFCKTDQTLICSLCSVQEHRGHDTFFMSEQDVRRAVTGEPEDFCTGGFQIDQTGWLQTLKDKHKEALKTQFEVVSEGIAKPGEQTLLDDIFTHVWITEGSCVEVNHGHEVMQVETVSKSTKSEIHSIKCSDIFKPLPGQTIPIRTVMMKGVAGIGKTFSVQKFILDWTTGKDNQDFDFIFFLPFRELNLIKSEMSLQELVLCFCPEIKSSDNVLDSHKVLFIFDGLDESQHPLDFKTNQRWSDVKKQASVDVLLTNLIKRNFPVNASIWITSRPAATGLIPPELISRVTEVQGFEDQQKEEYIRKKCKNRALADRIISHIKALRSLYILCYVPVFCWIVVTVLEHTLEENSGANPTTLTDFYTYFLLVLLTAKEQKEKKETVLKINQEAILKLGKLAFESLKKNIIVFYEKDLKKYGIDLHNSSLYSGVWKEIFKQESVLFQEKVYCFLHLTVQEYFAALYVLGSHQNKNINPLKKGNPPASTLFHLNKVALRRAIQSKTGHLDLFVRFLLGTGMKNNQELLKGFLSHTQDHSSDILETTEHIKKLIRGASSPERCFNLFHCLSELKDKSLMDEFNVTLDKGKHSGQSLSPSQCSALAYFSLLSEKEIDVFDMSEYATSEECVRRLLPVAKITKTLTMERCKLTQRCCKELASALQSQHSSLRELDLSHSNLGDSGVKLLFAALRHPNCKLTTLK